MVKPVVSLSANNTWLLRAPFDENGRARVSSMLDTGDVLRDDGIFARDGLAQVETRSLDEDTVLLAVRRDPVRVTGIQQSLRGDAAHRDADPTHTIALDERDTRSFDACVERRDVATGAAAEDGDVVGGHGVRH